MNILNKLETWFATHCDGDWEHGEGIKISTLDNPGWSIDIDLGDTQFEELKLKPLKIEKSDQDWIVASIENKVFKIRCGPKNLSQSINIFFNWVDEITKNLETN